MSLVWQEATVLLLVACAFFYLALHVRRAICRTPGSGCGGCAACPDERQSGRNLVQLKQKAAPGETSQSVDSRRSVHEASHSVSKTVQVTE
jgi:hypothetical protein